MKKTCCFCGEKPGFLGHYDHEYALGFTNYREYAGIRGPVVCHTCMHAIGDLLQKTKSKNNKDEKYCDVPYDHKKMTKAIEKMKEGLSQNPSIHKNDETFVLEVLEQAEKKAALYDSFDAYCVRIKHKIYNLCNKYPDAKKYAFGPEKYGTFFSADNKVFFLLPGEGFISFIDQCASLEGEERFQMTKMFKENFIEKNTIVEINIDDILFYQDKGDIDYTQAISGGGGGVNLMGAAIGGWLFDDIGALIGSRVGTEIKVESKVVEHDYRMVLLRYRNQEGKIKEETCPYELYSAFGEVMPEKDFAVVSVEGVKQEPQKVDFVEQIKQLKELFDMGVITEEEFAAKKKQILGI